MTVHIQSIQVQNLGPITSLQESLGQVNLFYGLNETGKTYLVEFLLHSLFRQSRSWDLRGSIGKGSVQVEGLAGEVIRFSPDQKRKLEHYWEEEERGLPLNMARLLVVKGGELDLAAGSPGGVDRTTLRSALTSQALLDQIWDSIPATVQNATVEDGQVQGDKRGPIKTQIGLLDEIRQMEDLLARIEEGYSQGPAREIERQIEAVRDQLADQRKAKRQLAFQTREEQRDLERQQESLKKDDIQDLRDAIRDLENFDRDIKSLEGILEEERERSKEYPWLKTALKLWEDKGLDQKKSPPNYLGMVGLAGLVIGAALLIAEKLILLPDLLWIGAGLAGIGFALSLYFAIRFIKWTGQIDESAERKSIREQYEEKFSSPLGGLADLKTRLASLQEAHISAQASQTTLTGKNTERRLQSQSIENSFAALTGRSIPENEWQKELADLKKSSEQIESDIKERELLLSKLDIPEEDYLAEPLEARYDPKVVQELENDLGELESNLAGLQGELETLKAEAYGKTGDKSTIPWTDLLFNLQSLLGDKISAYKDLTAELVAQIGLTQVLTKLRQEEDQKIIQAINTESITEILNQATGRYQKLDLVDDQIIVQDAFSSYALSDISTGAREQVQLALRLGIASHICGGEPLFLILDDAFQHSDWQRREKLVGTTLDLARSGWQILYLSMDDHIRDLFLKVVKPALKKDFKLIQLS